MPQQTITQVAPSRRGWRHTLHGVRGRGGSEGERRRAEGDAGRATRVDPTRAFSGRVEASTGAHRAPTRRGGAARAREREHREGRRGGDEGGHRARRGRRVRMECDAGAGRRRRFC